MFAAESQFARLHLNLQVERHDMDMWQFELCHSGQAVQFDGQPRFLAHFSPQGLLEIFYWGHFATRKFPLAGKMSGQGDRLRIKTRPASSPSKVPTAKPKGLLDSCVLIVAKLLPVVARGLVVCGSPGGAHVGSFSEQIPHLDIGRLEAKQVQVQF